MSKFYYLIDDKAICSDVQIANAKPLWTPNSVNVDKELVFNLIKHWIENRNLYGCKFILNIVKRLMDDNDCVLHNVMCNEYKNIKQYEGIIKNMNVAYLGKNIYCYRLYTDDDDNNKKLYWSSIKITDNLFQKIKYIYEIYDDYYTFCNKICDYEYGLDTNKIVEIDNYNFFYVHMKELDKIKYKNIFVYVCKQNKLKSYNELQKIYNEVKKIIDDPEIGCYRCKTLILRSELQKHLYYQHKTIRDFRNYKINMETGFVNGIPEEVYICYCGRKVDITLTIEWHRKKYHNRTDNLYACVTCRHIIDADKVDVVEHKKSHEHKYDCLICNSNHNYYDNDKHANLFKCSLCWKVYSDDQLNTHSCNVIKCKYCNLGVRKNEIDKHMKILHADTDKCVCFVCYYIHDSSKCHKNLVVCNKERCHCLLFEEDANNHRIQHDKKYLNSLKRYECCLCDYHTDYKNPYNNHIDTQHHKNRVKYYRALHEDLGSELYENYINYPKKEIVKYSCPLCNFINPDNEKYRYYEHIKTNKHRTKLKEISELKEKYKKFLKREQYPRCALCDDFNNNKNDKYYYNKHINTQKHKNKVKICEEETCKEYMEYMEICGKIDKINRKKSLMEYHCNLCHYGTDDEDKMVYHINSTNHYNNLKYFENSDDKEDYVELLKYNEIFYKFSRSICAN